MVRALFVRVSIFLVAMLFAAPLSIVFLTTVADQPDDSPLIGFDFENGLYSNGSMVISGFIEDEVKPSIVHWDIGPSSSLFGGEISSSLEEIDVSGSRASWAWSITLEDSEVESISPCTCYVWVTVQSEMGQTWMASRVLFLGETAKSAIIVHSPEHGEWAHGSILASGWSMYPMRWNPPELRIFAEPASSSVDACSEEADSDIATHLSVVSPEGDFSESINVTGLSDGWHSLYFENYDPSGVTYAQECTVIRVNNIAPVISIEGLEHSFERTADISFDASASDDPVWGREGMHFMWVLRKPSHSGQTPLQITMGEDKGTLTIPGDSSGDFTLSLTVTDAGGVSSTTVRELTIENVIPTAIASLDGTPIEDGSRMKLSPGSEWTLDASFSEDSENDLSGLRCVWKIDNQPVFEGCARTLSWPSYAGDEAILTLDVIDDDDEYGTISVLLVHPEASEPLPYPLLVLVVSTLFLLSAVFLRYRSGEDAASIPKWNPEDEG